MISVTDEGPQFNICLVRVIPAVVDFDEVRRSYEVGKFQFAVVELELAITFAEGAASANSKEKAIRNLENARRAHSAGSKARVESHGLAAENKAVAG